MNYRKLVGDYILCINNEIGRSLKKLYCTFTLCKVIDYDPLENEFTIIKADENNYHVDYISMNTVKFKIDNHDPFNDADNSLSYNEYKMLCRPEKSIGELYRNTKWYIFYKKDDAIELIETALLPENNKKPVFSFYYLSKFSYYGYKRKEDYLKYLLNILKYNNETNKCK